MDVPEDQGPPPTPDWIVTFTDLMSLLLTFFILLLTFSTPRVERLFELRGSIAGSFGIILGSQDDRDTDMPPTPIHQGRDQRNPYSPHVPPRFQPLEGRDPNVDLERLRDQTGEEIAFERIQEGYRVSIGEAVVFPSGSQLMTGTSFARLAKVAKALRHYDYHLIVVGYTGVEELDVVSRNRDDPMDLAIRRAVEVAKRLVEHHGIDRTIIGVAGYGPSPGDLRPGRVEIILADRKRFGGD